MKIVGPFPGRSIRVSTGVMEGCRPSTPHTVCVDTRFMARWMQAFRSCNTPITYVGWSASDHPTIPTPKTQPSTSKVRQLVQKLTSQPELSSSQTTTDKPEASKGNKRGSGRRRNRRKQS